MASALLVLATTHCVQDFAGTGGSPGGPPGPPPPPPPTAVALAITSDPSDAVAGTSIGDITVEVRDDNGRVVTAGSTPVTLSLSGGKAGASIGGTRTANTANGVATFSGLTVDSAASGYRIVASSGSLTSATSRSFDIRAGAAAKLMFVAQPTNTVALKRIQPAVRVGVTDAIGNVVSGADGTVRVRLNNPPGSSATLMGDDDRNLSNGVATFSDLRVTRTGTGFTLTATADGLAPATSAAFNSTEPNDLQSVSITQEPTDGQAARPMTPIRVAVMNALGTVVTNVPTQISVSLQAGTGKAGATLGGTLTQTTVNGEATFGDLTIDSSGLGYRIIASAPGLDPDTTTTFSIATGSGARLAFTGQPGSTTTGTAFNPPPQVTVLDAAGNVATGATVQVALYITAGTGTPGATLSGTTTVSTVGGVATFSGVSIGTAGNGYTLTAAAAGVASDISSAFNVTASGPPPAGSVTVTPGTASLAAFGATQQFSARVMDASGHEIPGASVFWSSSNAAAATVDANGLVTGRGNGSTTISATSGSASGTATVTVQQATAYVAILASSPDTLKSLGQTGTFSAEARDANGNRIAGKTVSWASNNTAVATIDATTGQVTAVANGTANITASVDGQSATQALEVRQAVASVRATPDDVTLAAGDSVTVTAHAFDARNNAVTRALSFTWSSASPDVTVTVDAADSSRASVKRVAASGSVNVTVTAETKSDTVRVR